MGIVEIKNWGRLAIGTIMGIMEMINGDYCRYPGPSFPTEHQPVEALNAASIYQVAVALHAPFARPSHKTPGYKTHRTKLLTLSHVIKAI